MTKWEYCIFTAYETSQQSQYTISYTKRVDDLTNQGETRLTILEKLGYEGWELVSILPLASGLNEFYFKREIL